MTTLNKVKSTLFIKKNIVSFLGNSFKSCYKP